MIAQSLHSKRAGVSSGEPRRISPVRADDAELSRSPARLPRRPSPSDSSTVLASRSAELNRRKIDYIDSDQFHAEDAELRILAPIPGPDNDDTSTARSSDALSSSLLPRLGSAPLLTPDEETYLFRKMNFLKFSAARLQKGLRGRGATQARVERIEQLLAEARNVEAQIVQANLRLVISIASKFLGPSTALDDLVSHGNMALLRAVEKFNFSRGYRFSTYATHAIRRALYRYVLRQRSLRGRFVSDELRLQAVPADPPAKRLNPAQLQRLDERFAEMLEQLDHRERRVLSDRFGLQGQPAKTFRTLGEELGVCKERIRQLQARALLKLKAMGGAELAFLLDESVD